MRSRSAERVATTSRRDRRQLLLGPLDLLVDRAAARETSTQGQRAHGQEEARHETGRGNRERSRRREREGDPGGDRGDPDPTRGREQHVLGWPARTRSRRESAAATTTAAANTIANAVSRSTAHHRKTPAQVRRSTTSETASDATAIVIALSAASGACVKRRHADLPPLAVGQLDRPRDRLDAATHCPHLRREVALGEAQKAGEDRREQRLHRDPLGHREVRGQERERPPGEREPQVGVEGAAEELEVVGARR